MPTKNDELSNPYRWFQGKFSNSDNQPDGNSQMRISIGNAKWDYLSNMLVNGWELVLVTHTDPIREPGKFMVLLKKK